MHESDRLRCHKTDGLDGPCCVECSIGGTPVQMAECQLVQGVNLIFIQVVTQLAEFVFSIAQMRNVFGCLALVLGSMHCVAKIISPSRLLSLLKPVYQSQLWYYNLWLAQYDVLWQGIHVLCDTKQRPVKHVSFGSDVINKPHPPRKVVLPRSCPSKFRQ